MTNYAVYAGKIMRMDEVFLLPSNRSFAYGDGLFESMYFNGSNVPLLDLHIQRLVGSMNLLHMHVPEYFSADYFANLIERLAAKNKIFKQASLRLHVYRESHGKYTPDSDQVAFVISMQSIPAKIFDLNGAGITLGLFEDYLKPINALSSVKSASAMFYVQAGIWNRDNGFDDSLVLNSMDRIAESMSSNIFLVKDSVFYTPPLSEGCLNGVFRRFLIPHIKDAGYRFTEKELSIEDVKKADEVFLTNAVRGITWVGSFGSSRFYNKNVKKLNEVLIPKFS